MINIVMFCLYVLLSSSGLILFKFGSLNPNMNINIFSFNFSFSIPMLIGIVCYCLSFLLWLIIVSRMNLTFAMPLSVALVNTAVIVGSHFILKENITLLQGIGIFVVILGVMLMTYAQK